MKRDHLSRRMTPQDLALLKRISTNSRRDFIRGLPRDPVELQRKTVEQCLARRKAHEEKRAESERRLYFMRIKLGIMDDSLEGVRDHCKEWLANFMKNI